MDLGGIGLVKQDTDADEQGGPDCEQQSPYTNEALEETMRRGGGGSSPRNMKGRRQGRVCPLFLHKILFVQSHTSA
jgi:hypothetical protein